MCLSGNLVVILVSLFYIYYFLKNSLTCFNNFNKTDNEKMNEEILTWTQNIYWKYIYQFPDLYMSSNSRWIYTTEAANGGVLKVCNFIKKRLNTGVFLWKLQNI